MMLNTEKISWKKIAPFVFFWMIPKEIINLKNFLDLFTNMTYEDMKKIIWYMMRSQDSWLINIIDQNVQTVYNCINCSPQLTIEHIKILRIGNNFLLRNQFTSIKRNIMDLFYYNNYDGNAAMNMIISVLMISAPELIEELLYHYIHVYQIYVNIHNCNNISYMYIEIPSPLTLIERMRIQERMCSNMFSCEHRMILMHTRLVSEISKFRKKIATQIVVNMKKQLINMHQMLEEYPLL